MKKIVGLLVLVVMLFSMSFTTLAENTIYVMVDGVYVEFDVKPQIINGRTMVPIRAIFEKMGATVEWNNSTSTAVCEKGDTVVMMTVDCMDMYVNGQSRKMDVSPVIIDGRTLAPARYVAEAFGGYVEWDQVNNTVLISTYVANMNSTTNSNQHSTSNSYQNQMPTSVPQGNVVYIGQTGTKYHYKTCRTLKNGAYPITLEEALAQGREACKVCHR